jgi:hypothetical protein
MPQKNPWEKSRGDSHSWSSSLGALLGDPKELFWLAGSTVAAKFLVSIATGGYSLLFVALHAGCADFRRAATDHANHRVLLLLHALKESQALDGLHRIIAAYSGRVRSTERRMPSSR